MPDIHPDKWLTLDESIVEDIGNDPKLQAEFDVAGKRVELALLLYELRNSYNLTKHQFGKIVGLTTGQITKIERVNFTEPPEEVFELVRERMNRWIDRINSVPDPLSDSRLGSDMALKTNSG